MTTTATAAPAPAPEPTGGPAPSILDAFPEPWQRDAIRLGARFGGPAATIDSAADLAIELLAKRRRRPWTGLELGGEIAERLRSAT